MDAWRNNFILHIRTDLAGSLGERNAEISRALKNVAAMIETDQLTGADVTNTHGKPIGRFEFMAPAQFRAWLRKG